MKHPIRSSEDGKLHIKLSPGGIGFERLSDGNYRQSVFILGGQSQIEVSAAQVAASVAEQCEIALAIAVLEGLEWKAVILELEAIGVKFHDTRTTQSNDTKTNAAEKSTDGDKREFYEILDDDGELIAYQEWCSGGSGAGAGIVKVYALRGKFIVSHDAGFDEYKTASDAVSSSGVRIENDATVEIWIADDINSYDEVEEDDEKGISRRYKDR